MRSRQLLLELQRLERLVHLAVEAWDVSDFDELGKCVVNFGESLSELVDEVEADGVGRE